MNTITAGTRLSLAAAYGALLSVSILALYLVFRFYNGAPHSLGATVVILCHAFPLLLTVSMENHFFGGPAGGGLGAVIFVGAVAIQWSPLLVLACFPGRRASSVFRRATGAYFLFLAVLTIASALWLINDPSLLAS